MHLDLGIVKEKLYDACAFEMSDFRTQEESTEYAACSFQLNAKKIEHRLSKITPTKIGQFVTIWKRNTEGITVPYSLSDGIDFIIITSRCKEQLGQFIFPIPILVEKGIVSSERKEGKRGIRVYPPWDKPTSKQALATQKWQQNYFVSIHTGDLIDIELVQLLFKTNKK
ncbi:MepB family protein [uncultured Cytophaga sp.]|uniref:MepB family protein n=1 Tax=uncultured Cytophaga sp. TaxID=160238 RepID=UPI0026390798|nr:MepB family protein [uncultured Cytophaga sp.]